MGINIKLKTEDAESIDRLVASGRYATRDDVIHEAIKLVSQHDDWLAMVEKKVAQGRADAAAGRMSPVDKVFDDLEARFAVR